MSFFLLLAVYSPHIFPTTTTLSHVDIAIPCNNKSEHSIGLLWWMLAREVNRLRGNLPRELPWDVMPDLFFYRKPEDIEAEEAAAELAAAAADEAPAQSQWDSAGADAGMMSADTGAIGTEWAASMDFAAANTGAGAPATTIQPIGTASFGGAQTEEWGATAPDQEWGASADWQ